MKREWKIGDEVWGPTAQIERIEETCPDCLGSARWHCSLPNGEEFDVECPRCYPGGYSASTGRIHERYEVVPRATLGVVNKIEIKPDAIEYGTTAGYVHGPEDMCETEAEAVSRSVIKARAWADEEFKRMDHHRRTKGRPKKCENGERVADHSEGPQSVNYARGQVRKALGEARRWTEYAARKGASIDILAMLEQTK